MLSSKMGASLGSIACSMLAALFIFASMTRSGEFDLSYSTKIHKALTKDAFRKLLLISNIKNRNFTIVKQTSELFAVPSCLIFRSCQMGLTAW